MFGEVVHLLIESIGICITLLITDDKRPSELEGKVEIRQVPRISKCPKLISFSQCEFRHFTKSAT